MSIPGIIVTPLSPSVLLSASDIQVVDAGGKFVGSEVETCLSECATSSDLYSSTKYFGDPSIDGSWRMRVSGTDFLVERRESGVWIEKGSFFA